MNTASEALENAILEAQVNWLDLLGLVVSLMLTVGVYSVLAS